MNKLRKLFIFRSASNFSISMMVVSGSGYLFFSWRHDKQFQHPLITESIRILSVNPQVVELTGYPLSIQSSLSSNAQVQQDACKFDFQVKGPKGVAHVELQGSALEIGKITPQARQIYYVPSKEILFELHKRRNDQTQLDSTPVPKTQLFWKFDQLSVDIGTQGDLRIRLADSVDVLRAKEPKQITVTNTTDRNTLADIQREVDQRRRSQPTSEQDIEDQRRYRQNEMYQKIGSMRTNLLIIAMMGGMATYVYLSKNKRVNINRSQLHMQSLDLIKRNPYILKTFGSSPRFNDQLRGAQVGDEAEFETDIMGNKSNGVAYIKGNRQNNNWNISSIEVALKNKNGNLEQRHRIV